MQLLNAGDVITIGRRSKGKMQKHRWALSLNWIAQWWSLCRIPTNMKLLLIATSVYTVYNSTYNLDYTSIYFYICRLQLRSKNKQAKVMCIMSTHTNPYTCTYTQYTQYSLILTFTLPCLRKCTLRCNKKAEAPFALEMRLEIIQVPPVRFTGRQNTA